MKFIEVIMLIVMIILLAFSLNVFYASWPKETKDYDAYVANLTVDAKAASVAQFYPNMRYVSPTITFSVEEACSEERIERIKQAHSILEDKTILQFVEKSSDGEITYTCSNEAPDSEYGNHYVAGEGGPTSVINTTLFAVIKEGQVSLYREEKCDTPQVALHETLHALGFDHVKSRNDIMYPITECDQEMSPAMVDAINTLYSIPSEPDVGIEYVKANQTGKFLNFYITVSNYGLRDSKATSLTIYADSNEVKTFELGDIKIGTKKFLNVQNMRVSSADIRVVKFVLNFSGDDIYKDNDYAELNLKYE